jgi:hypothetical protein
MRVRIKKHHGAISNVFPLNFETTYTKEYTKEDKVTEGFWTKIHNVRTYVPEVVIPKGSFKDLIFIGKDGKEYSGDWFYKCTGRSFTEFVEKLK